MGETEILGEKERGIQGRKRGRDRGERERERGGRKKKTTNTKKFMEFRKYLLKQQEIGDETAWTNANNQR